MRNLPHRCVRRLLVALPLSLTVSCGAVNAASQPAPPGPRLVIAQPSAQATSDGAEPSGPQIDPAVVQRAADAVEPNTTVGAVVFDRMTEQTRLTINPDRQFRSASLVKLLIAIDVLERGADAEDRRQLAQMLAVSDDDIASSYWVLGGRPDIVRRTSAALGLTGTQPPEDPGMWGEVLVTPGDVARVYEHILDLPTPDQTLIVDALAQAPRYAADGFDQHFGIPDGLRAAWAVKQGWGNNEAAMVLHSTGIAGPNWRYVVVLLTEHPLGSGWETSARSVTAAAASLHGLLPRM